MPQLILVHNNINRLVERLDSKNIIKFNRNLKNAITYQAFQL